MKNQYLIVDFDSTFIKVEVLEELAKIVLDGHPDDQKIIAKLRDITNKGMEGKISFQQSLSSRIKLLKVKRYHLIKLQNKIRSWVSESIKRNKKFLVENKKRIFIISGAFKEYILPVVKDCGLEVKNVFANSFVFNKDGEVAGVDKTNPLSGDDGKINVVRSLKLKGQVFVIGDGMTDYKIKEAGLANKFFAFCENVRRKSVVKKADAILENLDQFIDHFYTSDV